jgi:hypothetical protein
MPSSLTPPYCRCFSQPPRDLNLEKDRVVDARVYPPGRQRRGTVLFEQVKTRDPRVPCLRLQSSPSATECACGDASGSRPPPCTTKDSLLLRHAPEQERVILLLVLGKWKVRD